MMDSPSSNSPSDPCASDKPEILIPVYRRRFFVQPTDIDEFGHVNNVSYVHWMQNMAVEHSAAIGWPAERYTQQEVMWVVRRHTVTYCQQAFLNDEILAETWVAEMKHVFSNRRYRFSRVSDHLVLATAETRWAFISTQTGHPVRIFPEIQRAFQQIAQDNPQTPWDTDAL